jgi:hypothetical protein
MTSLLSVVNDTPDIWQCVVGPDQAALSIFSYVAGAIAAAATIVATAGSAAPLVSSLAANGVISILGMSTAKMAALTAAAAPFAGAAAVTAKGTSAAASVVAFMGKHMQDSGYDTILPGEKKSYSRTLSLWQQAECVSHQVVSDVEAVAHRLYMRPIFSGALIGSELEHSISWWINKWGTERTPVVMNNPIEDSSNEASDILSEGSSLEAGGVIMSPSLSHTFIMQSDGNAVVYNQTGSPLWASNTFEGFKTTMQDDGNLVVYNVQGQPLWASSTEGVSTGPFQLRMQDDGNLVIYDGAGQPTWASQG